MSYTLFFSLNSTHIPPEPPFPANDLLTNLQGYWKCDEGSGAQVMDSFVYDYDSIYNGTTSVPGIINTII